MADTPEKKPVEAPTDQPKFTNDEVSASDADMALAAMGYKPVSFSGLSPEYSELRGLRFLTHIVSSVTRSSNENLASGLPLALP